MISRSLSVAVLLGVCSFELASAFPTRWTLRRGQARHDLVDWGGRSVDPRTHVHMLAQGFGKPPMGKTARSMAPSPAKRCPCFSGKKYGECCKPFHDGDQEPQPAQVMRARYAAYASGMTRYIMESTHPHHDDYGKASWEDELQTFCKSYRFTGLEVGSPEADPEAPDRVFVCFTAMMSGIGRGGAVSFDERSLFVREDGRWLYRAADKNYEPSVDVISRRRFNRAARMDAPKGNARP